MENLKKENLSTKRDYDKDPIIIKDYNSLFLALWTISAIPIVILIYIFNPGDTSSQSLSFNVFVIIPLLMFPYIHGYFKTKGKRKIVLTENKISFFHNTILLEEIKINEISEIKKTYSDLYHVSQYPNEFGKFMSYILFPIALYMNSMLIINKFLFHLFKNGYKSYRFYDAIMIFSGDKFINILPTTIDEYNEIEKYIEMNKKIKIATTKVFYDFFGHMPEKIDVV